MNVSACCAIYPIANTWDRNGRSSLNAFLGGLSWASAGEATTVDMSYSYSYAKERINTTNPYRILAGSPRTAGAYNYPETRNRFHEVIFSVSRRLRPGLDLGFQYRFEG